MLKRVAVVGGDGAVQEAAQRAVSKSSGEVEAVVLGAGAGAIVPEGTVALLADASHLEAVLPLVHMLGDMHERILNLLADSVDCREGIPAGSSNRLRDHAARFATVLGLSAGEKMTLERGALLHDIGKIRISNDVLLKNTVLSYDEWILLQQHTVIGAELLKNLACFTDVVDIVRSHHECFDGTGYPDKLEGEAIPLQARIMKIIDVYCAMTSPRHYRSTHCTHDEAVQYLESERGKHYDPELVDVFLKKKVGQT
jgi:putative nucleotidyltransferase with HDIG domain